MKEQIEEIIKQLETRLPQHKCYCILERDYDRFIEEVEKLINNKMKINDLGAIHKE